MEPIRLNGRIDEDGHLEVDQPSKLPPGEVIVILKPVDTEEVAADDARWAALFAASQDLLAEMADRAAQDWDAGLADDLDPDTL